MGGGHPPSLWPVSSTAGHVQKRCCLVFPIWRRLENLCVWDVSCFLDCVGTLMGNFRCTERAPWAPKRVVSQQVFHLGYKSVVGDVQVKDMHSHNRHNHMCTFLIAVALNRRSLSVSLPAAPHVRSLVPSLSKEKSFKFSQTNPQTKCFRAETVPECNCAGLSH